MAESMDDIEILAAQGVPRSFSGTAQYMFGSWTAEAMCIDRFRFIGVVL